MIGQHQIVIDASEFLKGMSTGNEIGDGGFSNASEAFNMLAVPGVLYAPAQAVDSDTDARLSDEIVASCPDDDTFVGYERKMVTENGRYFRYNGTKIPEAALRTDATNTYQKGFTDMISFDGEIYATSKETIIRWDEGAGVFNASFASFISNNRPHPALVYENNAFFGDKNLLLRMTGANVAPATILTLSTDQEIIALGIDQATGYMLISTTNSLNISNTLPGVHKILWYDGFSNKVRKSIIVDDMVTAFYSLGGVTYVGYSQYLGYLNGSGITYLRTLPNVTFAQDNLLWKQCFAHIGSTLYVIDGHKILAFGEVLPGKKIFYYCYRNNISGSLSTNTFKCIFPAGQNKLGLSAATTKFYTLNVAATPSNIDLFSFVSNRLYFPYPVEIVGIFLEYNASIASTNNFTIAYQDQDGGSFNKSLTVDPAPTTSVYEVKEIVGFQDPVRSFQLRIQNSTENDGLKRIIIYYNKANA